MAVWNDRWFGGKTMPPHELACVCDDLVRKMTEGDSLDDAERSHLATCESCIARVVRALDEAERHETQNLETIANGAGVPGRVEAQKALEQTGRISGSSPRINVIDGLLLPGPVDRPTHLDPVIMDDQDGCIAVLRTKVRRGGPPLPLSYRGQVKEVDRFVRTEAEVFEPKQVFDE